jgi:hypothetical protein
MDDVAPARPDDLELGLAWRLQEDGTLRGVLRARNVSQRRVRIAGKPALHPLADDGVPLGADSVVTAELRLPGYLDIDPGQVAESPVGWAGWVGHQASGDVVVEIAGAEWLVRVVGPRQPEATGPATNLWSSWFSREDG